MNPGRGPFEGYVDKYGYLPVFVALALASKACRLGLMKSDDILTKNVKYHFFKGEEDEREEKIKQLFSDFEKYEFDIKECIEDLLESKIDEIFKNNNDQRNYRSCILPVIVICALIIIHNFIILESDKNRNSHHDNKVENNNSYQRNHRHDINTRPNSA